MALTTAYHLPFLVSAPSGGALALGDDCDLHVQTMGPPSEEAVRDISATVTAWGVLAATGAMCGEGLSAPASGIDDLSPPTPTGKGLRWSMSGVKIDDRAAVVLAHLLMVTHETHPLMSVELTPRADPATAQPMTTTPQAWDIYPGQDRSLRFPCQTASSVMGSGYAQILFHWAPDPAQQAAIWGELLTWAGVTTLGAYGIAPTPPSDCGLVPETELEFVDDELVWPLASFRAHEGAVVALANVVSAIDQRLLGVRELVIE